MRQKRRPTTATQAAMSKFMSNLEAELHMNVSFAWRSLSVTDSLQEKILVLKSANGSNWYKSSFKFKQ